MGQLPLATLNLKINIWFIILMALNYTANIYYAEYW